MNKSCGNRKTFTKRIIHAIVPVKKTDGVLIARAAKYLQPYRLTLVIAFVCLLAGIGFGLLEPLLMAKVVTSVFSNDMTRLLHMALLLGIAFLLNALMEWLQASLYARLNEKIVFDIKSDMFKKIVNLPTKAFDEMRIGEFISRLNRDAGVIANILTQQFVTMIVDIIRVIIIGVIIFKMSWQLSLAVVCCLSVSYIVFIFSGKIMRRREEIIARLQDSYFSNVQETVTGIREIKCMGIQRQRIDSFLSLGIELMNKGISIGIFSSGASCASQVAGCASELTAMVYGFILIGKKVLNVEQYIAYLSYAGQFYRAILNLTRLNSTIQEALVSLKRIFELIDSFTYTPIVFGSKAVSGLKLGIEFNNVHFSYNGENEILQGVSFTVGSGTTTAIVGHSGSGKTTIFNLLLRLYDPAAGKISIDSVDITDLTENALRESIAVVRQDPYLFRMSIRENLLLAAPNVSENEMIHACKMACIHDDIMHIEHGYDTIVGEDGITLSVGQKQRVAIARALLRNAPIILLDEATSALDNQSQSRVKTALDNISRQRTIIIIAHRLSTIVDADSIIVINHGKIDGIGSYSCLFNENDVFRNLYRHEYSTRKTALHTSTVSDHELETIMMRSNN